MTTRIFTTIEAVPRDISATKPVPISSLESSLCDLPSLQIIVLTASRPESLQRLLLSLAAAEYGCATIDLQINVDMPSHHTDDSARCVEVAAAFSWTHGRKVVHRRLIHAGLSNSWFEVPYITDAHEFVAIFEDDMEFSIHFYKFFSLLVREKSFSSSDVSALCLHPNDWEVQTDSACRREFSSFLYLSPEPCNWGPIWKYDHWRRYIDWVFSMKLEGQLPLVEDSFAYNYNKYLLEGKDVQSSWVWRYNFDFGKTQLRYSFTKCMRDAPTEKYYFAINHKEPGEHFKTKLDLQNNPRSLRFDFVEVLDKLYSRRHSFFPAPFPRYAKNAKSLHG